MLKDAVCIDLDYLPPTSERLCMIPDKALEAGRGALWLNIIDNFPWDFEPRMKSSTCCSEDELNFLSDKCSRLGIRLFFTFPGEDDFIRLLRLRGYSHLRNKNSGQLKLFVSSVGFRHLIESVLEDYSGLCQGLTGFVIRPGSKTGAMDNEYNNIIAEIVNDAGLEVVEPESQPECISAESFLSGMNSKAMASFASFSSSVREYGKFVILMRQRIIMSTLAENPPAAGKENLNTMLDELENRKSDISSESTDFRDRSAGIFDARWVDIFIKAALFSVGEDFLLLTEKLRQQGLLISTKVC